MYSFELDPVQGPDLDLTEGDQDPGLTEDQGAGLLNSWTTYILIEY